MSNACGLTHANIADLVNCVSSLHPSSDEIDDGWSVALSEKLIDEFEDVSHEEKLFFKLWNRHMKHPAVIADAQVPTACAAFARM